MTSSPKKPKPRWSLTILSDGTIREKIESGEIGIYPLLDPKVQVRGAKVDLRLDNVFRRLKLERATDYSFLPPPDFDGTDDEFREKQKSAQPYEDTVIGYKEQFVLHPGSFALAQTYETIRMPTNMFGRVEGRSSLARRGVLVHVTASGIDPGFKGVICLELYNVGLVPVKLSPLMRMASITFEMLDKPAEHPYNGKFGSDIRDVDMSKIDEDWKKIREAVDRM